MIDTHLCDLKNLYNPQLILEHLPQQFPPELKAPTKPWFDGLRKFSLEGYLKSMRKNYRDLGRDDHPGEPVDLLAKLSEHVGGEPWIGIIARWLGELVCCAHPDDDPLTSQKRIAVALSDRSKLLAAALELGHELWDNEKLSETAIYARLNNWLADHCAATLYGSTWLRKQVWPKTFREQLLVSERRSPDTMAQFALMSPRDAVVCAQLEKTFGEPARKLGGYPPDHPFAVSVKIETPLQPPLGQKAWLLVFALVPVIKHHKWTAEDVCRALVGLRPDLASQWAVSRKDAGAKYVREQVFEKLGIPVSKPGARKPNALPVGYGMARLIVDQLHRMPNF